MIGFAWSLGRYSFPEVGVTSHMKKTTDRPAAMHALKRAEVAAAALRQERAELGGFIAAMHAGVLSGPTRESRRGDPRVRAWISA